MLKHSLVRFAAASVLVVLALSLWHRPTATQGAPSTQSPPAPGAASSATGSLLGSPAGAFATHDIVAPAGARVWVTLVQTSAPCLVGRKDGENRGDFYVEADLQPGRAGPSAEQAACRQVLTFVSPGRATRLRVANYSRGFAASYTLSVTGASFARVAQCQSEWDLAADFQPAPAHANPGPDRAGRPGVWAYMESPTLTRNPAAFTLMPSSAFNPAACGYNGLQAWVSAHPDLGAPAIVFNRSGASRTCFATTPPIAYPGNRAVAHPGNGRLIVVRWRSPVRDSVRITVSVKDADAGGGDGVQWYLAQGTRLLRSSGISNGGGPQTFGTTTSVAIGEDIYLMLDPKDDFYHDSTLIDFTVRAASSTCPAPTACPNLKAPAAVVEAAIRNPEVVNGWGMLCNPNTPYDPVNNGYRSSLNLRNPNEPYDGAGNPVEYRCGCR